MEYVIDQELHDSILAKLSQQNETAAIESFQRAEVDLRYKKLKSADEPRVIDKANRVIRFTGTTSDEDRMGDTVQASGADVGPYVKNPVFLWSHDHKTPAVGRCIRLMVSDKKIEFDIQFAETPLGKDLFYLYSERFMSATSIGFLPLEMPEKRGAEEGGRYSSMGSGYNFKKWELLELSAVDVPANPNALRNSIYQNVVRSFGATHRGLNQSDPEVIGAANAMGMQATELIDLRGKDYADAVSQIPSQASPARGNDASNGQKASGDAEVPAGTDTSAVQRDLNDLTIKYTALAEQMVDLLAQLEERGIEILGRGAVSHASYPLMKPDASWSGSEARQRMAKWAGGPDPDKIDWKKFAKGFAYVVPGKEKTMGGYKLPHHDVVGGQLKTNLKGVMAAMAALLGARGGVDMESGARKSVYNHLAKHYREFKKEPPAFKSYGEDEMFDIMKDVLDPKPVKAEGKANVESDREPYDDNMTTHGPDAQPTGQVDKEQLAHNFVKLMQCHKFMYNHLKGMHLQHCGYEPAVGEVDMSEPDQPGPAVSMEGEDRPPQPPKAVQAPKNASAPSPVMVNVDDLDALIEV